MLLHCGSSLWPMSLVGHERRFLQCLRHVRSTTNTRRDSGHPKSAASCHKQTSLPHQLLMQAIKLGLFDHLEGQRDVSLSLFDLSNRELPVDTVRHETDAVAGLDCFQHCGIARAEHHRHSFIHVELFERAVLDRDFAG
jgi:hypothetical protein